MFFPLHQNKIEIGSFADMGKIPGSIRYQIRWRCCFKTQHFI